ncbi:phosphoesterase [Tuwongella immobilis]|uniref:Phosphoesterase: MutT/nudix family protein n=1 Tax=Tuwongella immobilis TaxID=692036 RepID=A0A6C2YJK6_9BACT|nr:phosphoesterase [Tuwongella immobilis]VIP01142.1 phosphoesterase : MutT/nudix family protein OS=Rhodopirellula maiorica SM1 GN=RMSM_00299 PE=4 SV=1 [Tuwongella immobilis]VTR97709.1 phosphoesterase : MutT/nudix family protein OS=Rhodopirellula maiorica SM1 GN=RMSM_00299 PE=4 SV=1 [Tuwongella immobilis]
MEQVLVIPRQVLQQAGLFSGFRAWDRRFAERILDRRQFQYRPRETVEYEPGWIQLIPYVVLTCGREVFHYTRGGGLEDRLMQRRSIGLGGHLCAEDAVDGGDPFRTGMLREVFEEIEIFSEYTEKPLGFLYDPSIFVGTLHLGIAHQFLLQEPVAVAKETGIDAFGFAPIPELRRFNDQFESWSRWILDVL